MITTAQLVERVARESRLKSKKTVRRVIETFLWNVKDEAHNAGKVRWPGFGVWELVAFKGRFVENVENGEQVFIPPGQRIRFRPSKRWRRG